jgi:hypothetical protein
MPFCVFALRNGNRGAVNSEHVVRVEADAPGCLIYFDEGKPWGVNDAFEEVVAALSGGLAPSPSSEGQIVNEGAESTLPKLSEPTRSDVPPVT